MKQFKFDDEQIVIDKYLPISWPKKILSCLLINSDAIEVTIRNIPIDAFFFKTIKKFIGLLFSCIEKSSYRYTYFNYVLQDNGLLQNRR
jgi:hypothetical protein